MEGIMNWFHTDIGLGITVAIIIFLITLILAAKRLICMPTTIVLLLIALGVGYALANRGALMHDVTGTKNEPLPSKVVEENSAAFEKIEQAPEEATINDG